MYIERTVLCDGNDDRLVIRRGVDRREPVGAGGEARVNLNGH